MLVLFLFVALLMLSLLLAFFVRASWAFTLPGMVMLLMLLWIIFAAP